MKKVLINVEERELRVAILDDEQLVELYIESLDEKSILNNIYKGRVEDVLPGLKAAFVNVGLDRNAFLHFDDVRPDLLWAKYRELHPDQADEVPSAREALADSTDSDQDDSGDTDDRRKRRRGRRGGKKRRPDSEDSYSPGLPVGVTEDDLEDDDDDDTDVAAASNGSQASKSTESHSSSDHNEKADDKEKQNAASSDEASDDKASSDAEARKLARQERQRQRRERWEQRKLERQQRRQQERAEREANGGNDASGNDAGNEREPDLPPAAHGTRGAASAYDTHQMPQMTASQRRQNKARYGDNFGNIAPPGTRQQDHRDSQADFFGPVAHSTDEESSIWDERQPNLGPVPGLGKAFLDIGIRRERKSSSGNSRRQGGGNQNQQNRNRKSNSSSSNNNNNNNKRRGGKRRSMRKRDNRSYFAFSADDIDKEIPVVEDAPETTEEKPKKVVRKRKTTTAADTEAKPNKTSTRTATVKKTTTRTTKARTAKSEAKPDELPLDIAASEETTPAEKPKRTRKTTTTRTRKKAVEQAPEADLISAESEAAKKDEKPADKKSEPAEIEKGAEPVSARAPDSPKADKVPETSDSAQENKTAKEKPAPVETTATKETPAPADVTAAKETPAPAEVTAEPSSKTATEPSSSDDSNTTESGTTESGHSDERHGRRRRNSRAERAARHRQRKAEAAADKTDDSNGAADTDKKDVVVTEATSDSSQTDTTPAASDDNHPAPKHTSSQQQQHSNRKEREQRRRLRKPQFQEVFRKGDEIMVQVVKEEIGMKGARISSYVSLPGRYLVLLPYPNQEGGISRKVEDVKERKRLKNLLRDISSDETAFIVRTAGVYQEEKEIRNDVEFLSQEWKTIADNYASSEPKSLVYDDHDILYRLARDVFDDSVSEILIDSHVESEKLKGILGKLIPGLVDKVTLYSGAENIFQKYGINKQIQKAARRKVWLKSGGYLIIDEAEALTAIDVNTGKSVGKDDQEKLILRTNLEAARAVARELKLRDIGGLIVIDFIDMKDARNKDQVLSELKLQLRKDRSKTSVSAISEFGLVEMTRKRVRRSLRKTIFMDCPYCQGAGAVLNEQQIWLHIKHEVVRQLESVKPAPTLNITVNPKIRAYVDQSYRDVIRRLEQKYDTEIRITMSDIFHIENYQIEKLETTGVINGSATVAGR